MKKEVTKKTAITFLFIMGLISLLADFTHEGARSIYGPYLGLLGTSAFLIALISGLGEFIGQALRVVTGFIADKTRKYWTMMIVGYAINLLAIPMLMFVKPSIAYVALVLILLERVGKGIRAPAKSALTSFTTSHFGVGKAFALQELMDQIGAFLGPIFVFAIIKIQSGDELLGYQTAFGLLGIVAIMTLVVIVIARTKYPHPDEFEEKKTANGSLWKLSFIVYLIAIGFLAMGFIDYPILAFHMDQTASFDVEWIPLIYAMAMGIDALSALFFGMLFDKYKIIALIIPTALSIAIAPVFFLMDGTIGIILGIVIWGIAMGAMESVLKSVIASLVSKEKRATAYGIFYAIFGVSWFLGSTLIGLLYEGSILSVVLFSSIMEMFALAWLIIYRKVSITQEKKVIS